jgi:hypothetical protein
MKIKKIETKSLPVWGKTILMYFTSNKKDYVCYFGESKNTKKAIYGNIHVDYGLDHIPTNELPGSIIKQLKEQYNRGISFVN